MLKRIEYESLSLCSKNRFLRLFERCCSRPANSELKTPKVSNTFHNRNPRNLELMGLARKTSGLECSYPNKNYYNSLKIEETNVHVTLRIVNGSGKEVFKVSTHSPYIKQYLYKTSAISSYKILGAILGDRMMKCGFECVNVQTFSPSDRNRPKLAALLQALTEKGVRLEEPPPVHIHDWPQPLNYKPFKLKEQPNSPYEMLGSKTENHAFKRNKLRKQIEERDRIINADVKTSD